MKSHESRKIQARKMLAWDWMGKSKIMDKLQGAAGSSSSLYKKEEGDG